MQLLPGDIRRGAFEEDGDRAVLRIWKSQGPMRNVDSFFMVIVNRFCRRKDRQPFGSFWIFHIGLTIPINCDRLVALCSMGRSKIGHYPEAIAVGGIWTFLLKQFGQAGNRSLCRAVIEKIRSIRNSLTEKIIREISFRRSRRRR